MPHITLIMCYLLGMSTQALTPTPGTELATLDIDALEGLATRWLLSLRTENTRHAYARDFSHFVLWCQGRGWNLLGLERAAVDLYRRELEGAELAPTTVARRLSALASFYRYALDAGAVTVSPVERVQRPRVSTESPRLGLDREETCRLLHAAQDAGARDYALLCLLALNGLRVSEALALDAGELETERGHRVVRVRGKGGKVRTAPLAPRTAAALDAELEGRTTGPLFITATGERLNRYQVTRIIRRVARAAGIEKRLSPHSLRHTFVTLSLEAGAPIHVVQDAAGHASPETTRRYDRARHALDGHATYTLAVHLADGNAA